MQAEQYTNIMEDGSTTSDFLRLCHSVMEHSPLAMLAAEGPMHLVRYANPSFCRLAGNTNEELIGRPFALALPENEANKCVELLNQVYRTGETGTLADQEHTSRVACSGVYWSYRAWAIVDEEQCPTGVMIEISDTTEVRKAREQTVALNKTLAQYGIEPHELAGMLQAREQTVAVNEALLQAALKQQELTTALNVRLQRAMSETHHRVKNNLQVVAALAEMQMDGEEATVPVAALQRISAHVRALATLHDVLTQQIKNNAEDETLNTQVVLNKIMPLLQASIGTRNIRHTIAPINMPVKENAALSLLVSELVSNAAKHGEGDITVTLEPLDDEAHLVVRDKGRGFAPDFDPRKAANTGLELIQSMARLDLKGEVEFANDPEGGARVRVAFPLR